jgi:phage/plasmid-associated DNA primase
VNTLIRRGSREGKTLVSTKTRELERAGEERARPEQNEQERVTSAGEPAREALALRKHPENSRFAMEDARLATKIRALEWEGKKRERPEQNGQGRVTSRRETFREALALRKHPENSRLAMEDARPVTKTRRLERAGAERERPEQNGKERRGRPPVHPAAPEGFIRPGANELRPGHQRHGGSGGETDQGIDLPDSPPKASNDSLIRRGFRQGRAA